MKNNTWQKVKYSKSKAQKTRVYFVSGRTQIGKAKKKHPIKTLTNTINSEFLWKRRVGGGRDCLGKITKSLQL